MKRYKVLVSGAARNMLTEHIAFLAKVNPAAAQRLRREIMDGIDALVEMPERYPYLDATDRGDPYRKMVISHRYLVLYLVDGDTVWVEHILDGRQENACFLD